MALSKNKKQSVVADVTELLSSSKLTVVAEYQSLTVAQMQELRRMSEENGTTVKVVKNRLFKKAMESNPALKEAEASFLKTQLVYGFNSEDEVAAPQVFANFAKKNDALKFVGGITADGTVLTADDVKSLASLPSKDVLRGQLVGTIAAPISGFVNVVAGNMRGVLNVLNARAEAIK